MSVLPPYSCSCSSSWEGWPTVMQEGYCTGRQIICTSHAHHVHWDSCCKTCGLSVFLQHLVTTLPTADCRKVWILFADWFTPSMLCQLDITRALQTGVIFSCHSVNEDQGWHRVHLTCSSHAHHMCIMCNWDSCCMLHVAIVLFSCSQWQLSLVR